MFHSSWAKERVPLLAACFVQTPSETGSSQKSWKCLLSSILCSLSFLLSLSSFPSTIFSFIFSFSLASLSHLLLCLCFFVRVNEVKRGKEVWSHLDELWFKRRVRLEENSKEGVFAKLPSSPLSLWLKSFDFSVERDDEGSEGKGGGVMEGKH